MENNVSKIKQSELNSTTYPVYCNLYLIQKIYDELPASLGFTYGDVSIIINSIDSRLYNNLCNETTEIILLNQIYTLFMQNNVELSREVLKGLVSHLSSLYPEDDYNENPYDKQWNALKDSNYYKEIRELEDQYEQEARKFYSKYY